MKRAKFTSVRHIVRRLAPLACVAILGATAAGCGSDTKPGNGNDTPTVTTTPSSPTTTPAATSPKSGGAGF